MSKLSKTERKRRGKAFSEDGVQSWEQLFTGKTGWRRGRRGGSVGRALDSRSKDRRYEPLLRQEHKNKIVRFFPPSQKCCVDSLSMLPNPPCVTRVISILTYAR